MACNSCGYDGVVFQDGYWRAVRDDGSLSDMIKRCVACGERVCGIPKREVRKIESNKKIGVYLRRLSTQEKNCASDRIRGEWVIKNWPEAEVWSPNRKYDVNIIHHPGIGDISKLSGLKILDVCDPEWINNNSFIRLAERCDGIVVATQALKLELGKLVNKPIVVIGDGHDFSEHPLNKEHAGIAKNIVWFGYIQNSHVLIPYKRIVKEYGLNLNIIAQKEDYYSLIYGLNTFTNYIEWNRDTFIKEIAKNDIALLPQNGLFKSDNKDITATLCGLPVAKSEKDLLRFIKAEERNKEVSKRLKTIDEFDVKKRVSDYKNFIEFLKRDDSVEVYTAICGGYEKVRSDVKVYTENTKFIEPVMGAKVYKILSNKFTKAPYSIWIDGNVFLNEEPKKIVEEFLGDNDLVVFRHPHRNCIYEEHGPARDRLPDYAKHLIDKQIKDYKEEGMPEQFGLGECGMIIRRNNDIVREFNGRWWAEICKYSWRDQISFPYVLWKMGGRIKVKLLNGNVRNHQYFRYVGHQGN